MTRIWQVVLAGAAALGLAHPVFPQWHTGGGHHRGAAIEYRAARGFGETRADVRIHIRSGWRSAHETG